MPSQSIVGYSESPPPQTTGRSLDGYENQPCRGRLVYDDLRVIPEIDDDGCLDLQENDVPPDRLSLKICRRLQQHDIQGIAAAGGPAPGLPLPPTD